MNLYCALVWTGVSDTDPQVNFVVADTEHKAKVVAKEKVIMFLKECG